MAEPSPRLFRERSTAGEWAQFALLGASLVWTTLCLGGYRPETMVLTAALNGALLVVHLLARARSPEAPPRWHPAGWLPLPFLAYAALNVVFVSPVSWLGWLDWLVWAQAALVFWVVLNGLRSTAVRSALFGLLVALGLVAVVLAAYQRFVRPDWLMLQRVQATQFVGRASGPFGIPNSLAAFLVLLLPALGALTFRRGAGAVARVLCGYAAAVLAFGLALTISRGAWLALAAMLALWPLWAGRGSLARRAGVALLAAVAPAAAGWTLYTTLPGVRARIDALRTERGERTRPIMWRGAWKIFAAHPVFGGGAGAYNVRFEAHRSPGYQDEPRWAHNDYLNTLADYGAVGFGLAAGAVAIVVVRGRRRDSGHPPRDWLEEPAVAAGLAVGLGAFALQLAVDFNLKIPALAMTAAAVAALAVRAREGEPDGPAPTTRWGRRGLVLTAAGAAVAAWLFAIPVYRAEALRYAARQAIDDLARRQARAAEERKELGLIRAALERAVATDPRNGQAWADLAYATALWAHVEPARAAELGAESERQAQRALAGATIVPEFWIRRGVALDLQGRRIEAGRAFVRALQLAPTRATVWYYHAFHLALDRNDPGRALAAVDFCLHLDPNNPDALALRRRLETHTNQP